MSSYSETDRQLENGRTGHLRRRHPRDSLSRRAGKPCRTSRPIAGGPIRASRRPYMAALPTGTVTFLFTDIEGSTTLLQRLGDRRYAEVQEEHRRLLRVAFKEGNGQEVDRQGDSFLMVFSRAREAVAAQRSLAKYPWPEGTALRVRMGLHTGEPLSDNRDYVGLDVHRASRICSV